MSRPRVERLYADLLTDRVISASRAYRHYRVPLRVARNEGIDVVTAWLTRTTSARRAHKTAFLVLDERALGQRPAALRHLAGATAVRLELGVPADDWRNDAGRPLALHVPDALWLRADGPTEAWAVEVDVGSYTPRQIASKAAAFGQEYGMQVWAAATEARVAVLSRLLSARNMPARVICAPWW